MPNVAMVRLAFFFLSSSFAAGELYCPTADDFQLDGNIQWNGAGWKMTGSGGVHGRQTFNLLGGFVEFDLDTTGAHGGVNNNFYLVSPDPSYFSASNDCDIQAQGKPACMEMDIIENNGDCLAQTTWHTWPNHNGDCDQGGCWGQRYRSGVSHVRAEFTQDGWMTVLIDGTKVDVVNPVPSENAHKYVRDVMSSKGAQIQSSQWVGWVPAGNCPGGGDLGSSSFSIQNLRVSGTIVQGRVPATCTGPAPSPAPGPGPSPAPAPSPPQCPEHGTCGCAWAAGGAKCGVDDGSECFCRCCCSYVPSHTCKWHGLNGNLTVIV
eukprot:TRINITY_DN19824_c0_g1_i1.p1 TRINITY_DN19824_c0_g1~~TRINITY_DN19824_c0_g1_i1.p1  ORF type:complete len:320 (+),score=30.22 TRINITY_DN19824_c0_g1_i1:42-1001(+)